MGWSTADIPDQRGRVAVVTGANGGLGLETARLLAHLGAHVILAVRDQRKAKTAVADIWRTDPAASLEIVAVDLGAQATVRDAARTITRRHSRIDLLINNAGVMAVAEGRTVDGFERQLGVDHLGHWSLTGLLLPTLVRTPGSRVVTVTSIARHLGRPLDPLNPHLDGEYGPWRAYGQAKLANWHFGLGLHRLLTTTGATTTSLLAHPGAARTDLTAAGVEESDNGLTHRLLARSTRVFGQAADRGALPQIRAATDPTAHGGRLFTPVMIGRGRPVSRPCLPRPHLDRAIRVLWEVSARETGVRIDAHTVTSTAESR